MAQKFSDAARAELVAGINSSDVSFTIVAGGSLFPAANTGASAISNSADWFKLVLQDVDGIEIVYVRTHVDDSLSFSNILRGQEGTTAKEFLAGSIVGLRPLASDASNAIRLGDARDTAITLALAADPSWLQLADMPAVIAAGADAATARTAIGLGSVDNTSDASKPVSTAQQTALNLKVDTVAGKGLSTEDYSTAEMNKLAGVATGATANAMDADLRDRSTHTGAQEISTVTGLQTALDAKQASLVSGTNIKSINGASLLGAGDVVIVGAGAKPSLQGDTSSYVTQTKAYSITNFSSFSDYVVQVSAGSVSLVGESISFTAPNSAGTVDLTLTVDGEPTVFVVTVQAAGITQPTNVSPVNGATGTSNVPVLQSSAFSAYGLTDTQAAARWTIYQDGLQMHSSGWSTTELSSYSVPAGTVALSMTYSWTVEHRGSVLGDSPVSTPTTFTVVSAGVTKPIITTPVAEATGVTESPTITANAFATYGLADTHLNTDWELWTGPNRTGTKVVSLYNSTTNKTSWAIAAGLLTTSTPYYPAVMYRGTDLGSSEWAVSSFTTAATFNIYIPTPAPTPANYGDPFEGGFYMGLFWNQIMQSSSSKTLATGTQVFTVPDMTAVPLVYAGQQLEVRSRDNPTNKFIGTVIGAIGTSLTLNVSSIGGSGTFSDWSVMSKFRHIEAPKASGEHAGIAIKNANTALPTACQTLTEGWESTIAMVAAGDATTYPAAHWARNLVIGGKNDWHIPARDVRELSWRNGKPTTDANYITADRPVASTFNYMNNGSYGDATNTHGLNNNSVPVGAAYTTSVPAQTTATAFRTGGAEAFEYGSAYYWSSSDYNETGAWGQGWYSSGPGRQYGIGKASAGRVRAARRSII